MRLEIFSKSLDEIGDKYINEAVKYQKRMKYCAARWLTIAACLCLLVGMGLDTIKRFEWFNAGCGANIGKIVDGIYYYHVKSDGIYSYSPEEGHKKLLSTYWYDDFDVNEYGIYYKRGRNLYVQEHETGERRRLFRAGLFDSSHIGLTLQPDGNVIVTVYNKYREYLYELLLNGRTGEVLETVMEKTTYGPGDLYYSRSHFIVGEREIVLSGEKNTYDLLDNGKSILPEGVKVGRYSMEYIGDCLWFYTKDNAELTGEEQTMFVVRPDGNDEIKVLPFYSLYSGTNEYLFWTENETNEMWCFEIATGESWTLEVDSDMTIYSEVTDGEYVYSCVPWDDYQAMWKLIYDESSRPVGMELIDDDIRK